MTDYESSIVRGSPNYAPFAKLVLFVLIGVATICISCYTISDNPSEPDREIPIGASLLKTYDTHGLSKLKLWKLDGMCFVSYDIKSTSASLTYVPCPTQEKEKP